MSLYFSSPDVHITARFVSGLFRNPEDRFSLDGAHCDHIVTNKQNDMCMKPRLVCRALHSIFTAYDLFVLLLHNVPVNNYGHVWGGPTYHLFLTGLGLLSGQQVLSRCAALHRGTL